MSASTARHKLAEAHRQLVVRWHEAATRWDDTVSRSVQQQLLELLEADVHATLAAMEQLDEVLRKVRRDCE